MENLQLPRKESFLMNNHFPASQSKLLNQYPLTRELELDAAMCAWEYLLENPPEDWPEGSGVLRSCAGSIASAIHYGWIICIEGNKDYRNGCFDWAFVPWFIETNVILNHPDAYDFGDPMLKLDWVQQCLDHNKPQSDKGILAIRNLLESRDSVTMGNAVQHNGQLHASTTNGLIDLLDFLGENHGYSRVI
jgi:hypothetical protein